MTLLDALPPIVCAAVAFGLWLLGAYWFNRRATAGRNNKETAQQVYMLAGITVIGIFALGYGHSSAFSYPGLFRATVVGLGISTAVLAMVRFAFFGPKIEPRGRIVLRVGLAIFAAVFIALPLYIG